MSPRIMCHHHALSEIDREFIQGKVDRLKKFFDRIAEVSVILDAAKNECLAELLVFGPQLNLRVKDTAEDMRTAFEGAINKAERTLSKTKDKKWGDKKTRRRNVTIRRFDTIESQVGLEMGEPAPESTEEISIEHVEPRPMTLEEARETLLQSKNGLLVFVNPKTDEINLLHRNSSAQLELVELTGTVLFHPSNEVMELAEGL